MPALAYVAQGRMCNTAWCFDMFIQEPGCLDQVRI
jgi:hypothetical protein